MGRPWFNKVARPPKRLTRRLSGEVAGLHPGAFALVMATGILSTATLQQDLAGLSLALLAVAILGYIGLCILTGWRLLRFWPGLAADSGAPDRAFAFFTFVAASNVLGARLLAAGAVAPAGLLAAVGAAAWLVLTYAIPARLAARPPASKGVEVNGTWLIWVVGTQSVAVMAASLASDLPGAAAGLVFTATVLWAVGVVLYLVLITVIVARLFVQGLRPEQLAPPYWITMGATAITVFAASHLLVAPSPLPVGSAFVRGIAFLLWAFGSWWIPLLLVLGAWRHLLRRVPLRYETTLWSMVFPLGMYSAASRLLGQATGLAPLDEIARVEIWAGLVAWLLTLCGMVAAWVRPPGREPAGEPGAPQGLRT